MSGPSIAALPYVLVTPFNPTGNTTLAVSTVSANVALPSTGLTLVVQNTGAVTAYIALGDSSVTAVVTNTPVLAGQSIVISADSATYLAALTASSTTNLSITTGIGFPILSNAGSGGSGPGSAVSIADGADIAEGSTTDAAATAGGIGTVSAKLRRISTQLPAAVGTALTVASLPMTVATDDVMIGSRTETAPATDTASSGLNGRLQRIAQRLTSLIALLPAALGAGGGLKIDGSGTALPVSGTVTANAGTNLNTSALALETGGNLATVVTEVGSLTETAPSTDTASSGLNGRLQRIAQRLTSLLAVLPAALGQATTAGSLSTVPASDFVATIASAIVPNNTTAVVVKASAGTLFGVECFNNSATIAYLKIYDATSATAGSGTPLARYMIPAATAGGAGFVSWISVGRKFATGITYVVTTGIADNDTGAPAASAYIVNMNYK